MTSSLAQLLITCIALGKTLNVFWAQIYMTMYNSNKKMYLKEFWKLWHLEKMWGLVRKKRTTNLQTKRNSDGVVNLIS